MDLVVSFHQDGRRDVRFSCPSRDSSNDKDGIAPSAASVARVDDGKRGDVAAADLGVEAVTPATPTSSSLATTKIPQAGLNASDDSADDEKLAALRKAVVSDDGTNTPSSTGSNENKLRPRPLPDDAEKKTATAEPWDLATTKIPRKRLDAPVDDDDSDGEKLVLFRKRKSPDGAKKKASLGASKEAKPQPVPCLKNTKKKKTKLPPSKEKKSRPSLPGAP
jgi:hypothetical protein